MQCGLIPLSRGAPDLAMPSAQGFITIQGRQPPAEETPVSGPRIGTVGPRSSWIGTQWAPGQGGDTPGGGGAATQGMTEAVTTAWMVDGYVQPPKKAHVGGQVRWQGSRRGNA